MAGVMVMLAPVSKISTVVVGRNVTGSEGAFSASKPKTFDTGSEPCMEKLAAGG
jgi:hypothetical protein